MCFGYLGWRPVDFWRSNVWEITHAMEGLAMAKGAKRKTSSDDVRNKRLKAMLERQKEIERRRDDRLKRTRSQD